eukprot:s82_g20.t1
MFFLILGVSNHVLTVEHCRNDSLNLRKDGVCSATQEGSRRSHSWCGDKNHTGWGLESREDMGAASEVADGSLMGIWSKWFDA